MTSDIPEYIKSRIKQSIPLNDVIPYSTPVISFGNPALARVATLGINPSNLEFQCPKTKLELPEHKRRLQTLTSLGVRALDRADNEIIRLILKDCNNYFQKNPYRWFCQLEEYILRQIDVSYWNGSACHLDLVQWATKEKWGNLTKTIQAELLRRNINFLKEQLCHNLNLEVLLLNGAEVLNNFQNNFVNSLEKMEKINLEIDNPTPTEQTASVSKGTYLKRVKVIGWNKNIQSTRGMTARLRTVFGDEVKKLLENW